MTLHSQGLTRRALFAGLAFSRLALALPKRVRMGEADFEVVRNGKSKWRFLHIHGDETTAREVLRETIKTQKGVAVFVQNDKREIPIAGGTIDPNRMFSRAGAERNLARQNPNWSPDQTRKALDQLDRGRKAFLKTVLPPKGGILVALHNNSKGYSMRTEIPISQKVSLKDEGQIFNFLLASNASDFERLEKSPFNCVLQTTPLGEDDGSLSRLCASRGIRYINIEAALGESAAQTAMLSWCLKNLPASTSGML